MLDDIDRARLLVSQRDGQISYAELGSHVGRLNGTGHLERFLSEPAKSIGSIRRTHSIVALSSAKEPHEIDTSLIGSG
jgi:hypothetical protein